MPNPKRRHSKTRTAKRRTHQKAGVPTLTKDANTGEIVVSIDGDLELRSANGGDRYAVIGHGSQNNPNTHDGSMYVRVNGELSLVSGGGGLAQGRLIEHDARSRIDGARAQNEPSAQHTRQRADDASAPAGSRHLARLVSHLRTDTNSRRSGIQSGRGDPGRATPPE